MLALLVLAGLMLAAWLALDAGQWVRPERLREELAGLGAWGPVALMGVMALAVVIGPVPTLPVSVTAGIAFGFLPGSVYAVTGALAGALIAFWIARLAGRDLVARFASGHVALCPDCSDRLLFWVVLVSRLVPVVSFALVSYAAGLSAMRARAFALATLVGMLPMSLVYVGLGATVEFGWPWLVAGAAVVLLALAGLPRVIERFDPLGLRRLLPHFDD